MSGLLVFMILTTSGKIGGAAPAFSPPQIVRSTPLPAAPHPAPQIPQDARAVPGQVLIAYREDAHDALLQTLPSKYGAEVVYVGRYASVLVLQFPPELDLNGVIAQLRQEEGVLWAEPNYIYRALQWTPNDPYFSYQWHFDDQHINMPMAWEISQGGATSVKVGILDTGVAFEDYPIPAYEQGEVNFADGWYHRAPDLAGTNFGPGYDAIHNDDHPNDQNGHGTHVAGTVAQTTNNGIGVAGIAFQTTIIPIQALDYQGSGTSAQIADGIAYAITVGANVLNMSLGSQDSSHIIHLALIQAYNAGMVLVGATGNDGVSQVGYPAGFPEVIAVGATDYDDDRAPYSNYGPGIELVAPGGNLSEDSNGDGYPDGVLQQTFSHLGSSPVWVDSFAFIFAQGTSMAAPHVSGVAALILSLGNYTPDAVRSFLTSTAVDLGTPGYDLQFGYGRLDAYAALLAAQGGATSIVDTLHPLFQEPFVYFSETYQTEYEATRMIPSQPCSLSAILIAFYNYGLTQATKVCSVLVWDDGASGPGSRLLAFPVTITLDPGQVAWINFDVSSAGLFLSGPFWIGHMETTPGPPTSLADTIPDGTNMYSFDGYNWMLDNYDYLQAAVVVYPGVNVAEELKPVTHTRWKAWFDPKAQVIRLEGLSLEGPLTVSLYDLQGRKILADLKVDPLRRVIPIRPMLSSGVYFLRVEKHDLALSRKLLILR